MDSTMRGMLLRAEDRLSRRGNRFGGEHAWTVQMNLHGVFEMGRQRTINCHHSPSVI